MALAVALAAGAARADLNRLELLAIRQSGRVLDHGYVRSVFFAPLGLLWILRPDGTHNPHRSSEVLLTLRVERVTDGLRVTALDLGDGYPNGLDLPASHGERQVRRLQKDHQSVSADKHPLVPFHDRLLERPLARDLTLHRGRKANVTVPAGSRLRALKGLSRGYVERYLAVSTSTKG